MSALSLKLLIRNASYLNMLFGIVLGFTLSTQLRSLFYPVNSRCLSPSQGKNIGWLDMIKVENRQPPEEKGLIFVGVMTTYKFVDTRAVAIYDTWGKTIPGKLLFFSSENTTTDKKFPVVPLPGVDDSYPPQKKSFTMLKYIHDHYIDQYEWFVRADDDVYICTEKLQHFLRSVNSSKPLFIGQAGVGNKEDIGLLNLEPDENFCMGGPGVIMSQETLRRLAPHITFCMQNLYSNHEDVEVGRCVRKFVGIPCTWSYEMQSIFYHNFSGEITVAAQLKSPEVHRAITLHAIKQPPAMYRVHSYMLGLQTQELRYHTLLLHRDILEMTRALNIPPPLIMLNGSFLGNTTLLGVAPSISKFFPNSIHEILVWNFLGRNVHSIRTLNPRRKMEGYWQLALNNAIMEIMEMINKYSKQRGRFITFKELYYGYMRVNPLYGVEYILDLLMTYNKYRGKKMSVPVRRHAYVQQAFSMPEIREIPLVKHQTDFKTSEKKDEIVGWYLKESPNDVINFILPLVGRLQAFKRFLTNFENVALLQDGRVTLTLVLFEGEDFDSILDHFYALSTKFPDGILKLKVLNGNFSRAIALETGVEMHSPDSLLFFVDVDITFAIKSLFRIRMNTIQGKQVYFPIVFSRYDPATWSESVSSNSVDNFWIHEDVGYWRQFGYGIVSIYGKDFKSVGGFDTTIQGWGKEDVDLHTKVVRSNLTVFRAPDVGLVHIFHEIHCDPHLEQSQYNMCIGSKLSSLGSAKYYAKKILDKKYLQDV